MKSVQAEKWHASGARTSKRAGGVGGKRGTTGNRNRRASDGTAGAEGKRERVTSEEEETATAALATEGRVCEQTTAGTSGRPWQQRRRCRLWQQQAAAGIGRDHAESEATQTTAATGALSQGDEASGVETEEGGDQGRRAGGRNGRYNAQQAVPARRQASGRAQAQPFFLLQGAEQ